MLALLAKTGNFFPSPRRRARDVFLLCVEFLEYMSLCTAPEVVQWNIVFLVLNSELCLATPQPFLLSTLGYFLCFLAEVMFFRFKYDVTAVLMYLRFVIFAVLAKVLIRELTTFASFFF